MDRTHQAPLSMGFFRQEFWSGLPLLSPGDVPNQGTGPASLKSPALVGRFSNTSATWEAQMAYMAPPKEGVSSVSNHFQQGFNGLFRKNAPHGSD